MAYRTNADKVKAVLGGDYDGRRDLTFAIRSANIVITRAATLATDCGESIAAATLAEAETWVAAGHYIRSDRIYTSRSTLGASGSFKVEGENPYLTTAKDLDPYIAAVLDNAVADVDWLGKPESERLTYDERN